MKITYLGTTVLLFDDGKDQILFDAHVTRPSINKAFLHRLKTNEALVNHIIKLHHIDRLRAIFISHSHYDHILDASYFAKVCDADAYGSESALNVLRGGNVPEEKLSTEKDASVERERQVCYNGGESVPVGIPWL